jgi:hypothetical protein
MASPAAVATASSFWLTRVVFTRALCFLYGVAFLVARLQNGALIGDRGLTPANLYMDHLAERMSGMTKIDMFLNHPTLFWFLEPNTNNLNIFANCGLGLSLAACVLGSANTPLLFALWALYFSIVNVGQTWYGFGWESQLLESGFLAMFMVPVFSLARFPAGTATPWAVIWGYRSVSVDLSGALCDPCSSLLPLSLTLT